MFVSKTVASPPQQASNLRRAAAWSHAAGAPRGATLAQARDAGRALWDFGSVPSGAIQAKLAIGNVDDPLEREADRAAETALQPQGVVGQLSTAPAALNRKCASCSEDDAETDETLQRKAPGARPGPGQAPAAVHDVLATPGAPLPAAERTAMEDRFGHQFGAVRVHTDAKAAASAQALDAHAYTVGQHLVFGAGRYDPQSQDGRRLLAHELAHVVQQRQGPPILRRWAACSTANLSGEDCPTLSKPELARAHAGPMVFMGQLRDPGTGATGSLVANFDVGAATIKPSLAKSFFWKDFLARIPASKTQWKLLGFSDCGEPRAPELRKQRAEAVFKSLPPQLRDSIVAREAAPEADCVSENANASDRALNRSVAFVLHTSVIDFSADEENTPIAGKTPQDRLRECQEGAPVKTFPFRATRFGGAPIMAWRDGEDIVVKLPMHVKWNQDFHREVRTLPFDTFIGGAHLDPDEIVKVRRYESPHWYNFNITGDATGDNQTEYCVPAEDLLKFAHATEVGFWINFAVTGVEALTTFTPVGELAGAGLSKLTSPLIKVGTRFAQRSTVAGMLALQDVAPTAFAGEASAMVETRIADQAVDTAVSRTVAPALAPVVDTAAPVIADAVVPQLGVSTAAALAPQAATTGAAQAVANQLSTALTQVAVPGVGDRAAFRRSMRSAIDANPHHPLRFLLDANGAFRRVSSRAHANLIDHPEIWEAGHIMSDKLGGNQLMIQSGWENQVQNQTIERFPGFGVLHAEAIDIGGVPVARTTALWWEDIGWLPHGTVAAARIINAEATAAAPAIAAQVAESAAPAAAGPRIASSWVADAAARAGATTAAQGGADRARSGVSTAAAPENVIVVINGTQVPRSIALWWEKTGQIPPGTVAAARILK